MTTLGIDYGDRRLGLAISDPSGVIAAALDTLVRRGPSDDPTEELRRICGERGVGRIVVGVPINMDGTRGPRAKLSMQFAQTLRERLQIEVETWDERLTTRQADRAMLQADLSREKRKRRRDRLAAQLMLQSYLDARRARPRD